MTDKNPIVGADLLVIPDGADAEVVRIGIQVTPTKVITGDIPIDCWPAEIARLAERIRIRIASVASGQITEIGSSVTRSELAAFFDSAQQWKGKPRRDAARAMWQDIFQPVGFKSLVDAIGSMGTEQAAPVTIASTRTADLQLFLDKLLNWHDAQLRIGRVELARNLAGLARCMASWLRSGPDPRAALAPVRLWHDPMRERADQLDVLARGFDLMLLQSPLEGAAALTFAAEFEAEVGGMFREHWTRLFGTDEPKPPTDETSADDWGKSPEEAAGRKLSALLALPTLSHYLGLAVQVSIPRASLSGLTIGAIAAEFVDANGTRIGGETAWTAFELDGDHFGPAPNPEAKSAAGLFQRGFLNLDALIDGRTPRFALRSDDVLNTLHDLAQAVSNGEDPNLKRYRRGLVLYDYANREQLREDDERARSGAARINYLNDLMIGVRPDFAIATRGADSLAIAANRWRPVTFRSIVCQHDELDPAFYADPLVTRLAPRDHSYATALVEDKAGKLSREDEMFAWAGESLAVHVSRGDSTIVDPKRDLALQLTYSLPVPGAEVGMLPLREGVGYACGCRVVYVNGAGPHFDAAATYYAANASIVIGNPSGKPYVFPPAPLPPPDVHLGWDDPLVLADDPDQDAAGEASEILVLRDGTGAARRFVTPPRGSFDSAEQQRQFDDPTMTEDAPRGALSGAKGVWLFGPEGKFPEARFGKRHGSIRFLDGDMLMPVPLPPDGRQRPSIKIGSLEYQAIVHRQSRGTVAILGRRRAPAEISAPYYADANGGRLTASLMRASLEGGSTPTLATDRDFWKAPQRPADAVPIVMELRPGGALAEFAALRDSTLHDVEGHPVSLPCIRAFIPKGETYHLHLRADSLRGDQGEVVLRLVHAVEKPLRAPDFRSRETPDEICASDGIGLRAVTVTVRADDPLAISAGLEGWADKVRRYEASGVDTRCWPSEEGGTTTFFTGRVDFDRKSTGALRCEAVWKEFDEGTVSRAEDGRWIYNIAMETAQLFQFEVERRGSEGRIDLLREVPKAHPPSEAAERHERVTGKPGALRSLSYAFRDGRARELKIKVVATSAFTAFYPKEPGRPVKGEWISRFDIESSRFGVAPSVWTECTFRPPPPRIDRILPLFEWDKVPGQRESSRRSTHLRIYLEEGWFASGAEERLGIVLLNAGVDDAPKTVCAYEEEHLKPYHRFITRAGSDPTRDTSPVPLILAPRHFRNAPAPVHASLYLSEGDGPAGAFGKSVGAISPLPVTVLPYAPLFTEEDGLFCDIQLDIGSSYLPFLHLGVVRYQEHAVDHLQLSNPIEFDVQLLPERRLWVEVLPGAGNRTVVVEGPGFEVPDLHQLAHKRNELRLSVLSWDKQQREWQQSRVITKHLAPELDRASRAYRWKYDFELPRVGSSPQSFVLVVEEYERLPLDHPTGNYQNGEAEFDEVEGERLTYSCLLPLIYPRR